MIYAGYQQDKQGKARREYDRGVSYTAGLCAAGAQLQDIIAMDVGATVFIEVNARSSRTVGLGREAVTYAKQRNIIKAASAYLTENGLWDTPVRFDVAEVDLVECAVEYLKNAFQV